MHIRKYIYLILVMTMGLIYSSCTPKGIPTSNKEKTTNNIDSNHLRVALTGNPTSLDPQATSATLTAQISNTIYDTLLSINGTPLLAKNWEVSEDLLRWTFYLRENIMFHHGTPFSGEDVQATIERIKDSTYESPFAKELSNITEVKVDENNPLIVNILLDKPDSSMPLIFASSNMVILPKDLIEENHPFANIPVGTGPYMFEKWNDGEKISLKANNNYFLGAPKIKNLTFYIMPDSNSQVLGLQRNEIDIVPYIGEPELSIIKQNKDIHISSFPSATILVLAMNTRIEPFNDLNFRKAIAQTIDKQKVLEIAYPTSSITNTFWQKDSPFYIEIPEIYNPTAAKKVLEQYKDSEIIFVIKAPSNYPAHIKAAKVYQAQLENAGLNVEVQPIGWSTWLNEVYGKGNFEFTVIGHTGKISPYQRLQTFVNGGGYVGWKNEEFNNIMAKISKERSLETIIDLYQQAFKIMTEDYPFVFIGEAAINIAIRKELKNIKFDPILETYDFSKTSFSTSK